MSEQTEGPLSGAPEGAATDQNEDRDESEGRDEGAERKAARSALRLAPEAIGACTIAGFWTLSLLLLGGSIVAIIFISLLAIAAVGATIVAVDAGSAAMSFMVGVYLTIVGSATMTSLDLGPLGIVVVAVSIMLYLDLLRLSFARRRTDGLDDALFVRTIGSSAIVGVLSVLSIVIALTVTGGDSAGDSSRSWLWVPMAIGVIIVPAVVLVIASGRRSGQYDKRRWRPGERMLPQPNID